MTETTADLDMAIGYCERLLHGTRIETEQANLSLLTRYAKDYADPDEPTTIAIRTLALQAGASIQALKRILGIRRDCLGRTPLNEETTNAEQ